MMPEHILLRGKGEAKLTKKELEYFYIDNSYGGNQDWFLDFMMHLGGCAAVTACDSAIYLARNFQIEHIYPFDKNHLTKKEYIKFSRIMKPFLRPRRGGVDRLELYTDGFAVYLKQQGVKNLFMEPFRGEHSAEAAWDRIVMQIDQGLPIPYLLLRHQRPELNDYVWHWFLLIGYEEEEKRVKTVTYGEAQWLDFQLLWDTGETPKGGIILYRGIE